MKKIIWLILLLTSCGGSTSSINSSSSDNDVVTDDIFSNSYSEKESINEQTSNTNDGWTSFY